jgi:Ala-tRNA(Pro) deacylase
MFKERVMAISSKLRGYMDRCGATFDEVEHAPTVEMARAAQAAHIPGRQVAKGVVVRTGDQYMLVVIPASRRVELEQLQQWLGRDVALADEAGSSALFPDCVLGAFPPIGSAYGLETILDEDTLTGDDIYFEGGDHMTLVHVDATNWNRLQSGATHCTFSA